MGATEQDNFLDSVDSRLEALEKKVFPRKETPSKPSLTLAEEIRDKLNDPLLWNEPSYETAKKDVNVLRNALKMAVLFMEAETRSENSLMAKVFTERLERVLAILKGDG